MIDKSLLRMIWKSVFMALIASFYLFASPAKPAYASDPALPGDASHTAKTGLKHMKGGLPKAGKPVSQDAISSTTLTGIDTSFTKDSSNAGLSQVASGQVTASDWVTGEFTSTTGSIPFEVELTGTVEAIGTSSWAINGVVYLVDSQTKIEDMIQVGDQVEFFAYTTVGGFLALAKVELFFDDDRSDNDSTGNMDKDSPEYSDDDHDHEDQCNSSGAYQSSDDKDEDENENNQGCTYYHDDHEQNSGTGGNSDDHSNYEHDDEYEDHDD